MSLITRCPACETLFKVVPDQLRISEGWVRCGQCDEIFDASLHLLQAPSEVETPVVPPEESASYFEATNLPDAAPPPLDIDLDDGPPASLDESPVEQELVMPEIAKDEEESSSPESNSPAASQDPEDLDPGPAGSAVAGDVSFLRDNRPGIFPLQPFRRATLVVLSLTLLLGLVGQILFQERDRIVASEPNLKPWSLAICSLLKCSLSPLKRIESIVIDSSSFAKIRGDIYRLNFTLRNTAATALAVPALELTLTDSLDQPVVRRVFLPPELGVKSDTLTAGAEWPASFAVAVKAAGTADRVAGYRLLAFYP